MSRIPHGVVAVLVAGAAVEIAGPVLLARAARRAETEDLTDCHEPVAPPHPAEETS